MKKQGCILKIYKDGICTDFERFACKRANTVLGQYKKAFLLHQFDSFFFRAYREADKIAIIATPDGSNEGKILAEYTPEEFFSKIA